MHQSRDWCAYWKWRIANRDLVILDVIPPDTDCHMLRYTLAAAFVFFAIATVYYFSREATHVALRKPLGRTNESSTYWLVVHHPLQQQEPFYFSGSA